MLFSLPSNGVGAVGRSEALGGGEKAELACQPGVRQVVAKL